MKCIEARSIHEIDEERWDSITGSVLSMTHRWQRAMEADWRFYQPHYLLLEDAQGPCAAVVADVYASFKNLRLLGWLHQRLSLAVRPPFSSMCGVMLRPGVALEGVMADLKPELDQWRRRERRLLMSVDNVGASDLAGWKQAGFLAISEKGVSVLDLPASYEDYLQLLENHDRQELRRARRRGEKFDLRFEFGPPAEDNEQIYALVGEVFASHGVAAEAVPFTPRLFAALDKEMPGDVFFVRAYAGDTLAGACLCLLNGSTLWAPMIGLHYEIARPSYLYFLIFDEMIRWGIAHQIQKIFLGKTNERQKQRHGFYQEERWLCFRAGPSTLNRMAALALPMAQRLILR